MLWGVGVCVQLLLRLLGQVAAGTGVSKKRSVAAAVVLCWQVADVVARAAGTGVRCPAPEQAEMHQHPSNDVFCRLIDSGLTGKDRWTLITMLAVSLELEIL